MLLLRNKHPDCSDNMQLQANVAYGMTTTIPKPFGTHVAATGEDPGTTGNPAPPEYDYVQPTGKPMPPKMPKKKPISYYEELA